jgi:sigma-B regulation protein RsbU (phosphoserine phosphatase)
MRTAIFPAKFEQLDAIREFAAQAARDGGMNDSDVYSVELAVDEACSNIIEHAYGSNQDGDIECTCESDGAALTVVLRDHGKAFDPSIVPEPDLKSGIEDRRVGGLGIYMIKQVMDEVHFDPLGEAGNLLTMVKRFGKSAAEKASRPSPWRQIVVLGEQLMRAGSLKEKKTLIETAAAHLFKTEAVQVWLDESQVRLPGAGQEPAFPLQPPTPALQQAFQSGRLYTPKVKKNSLAFPLVNGNLVLGALQVDRPDEPFRKNELELLEVLVGHLSLALVASQRLAIEQWRIEQLTLVRRVSAQIANVFDLDELTRRITRLIQRTFNYYFVAVFNRQPGNEMLEFHSSSRQGSGRSKRLKAQLGEGLIGVVAQTGEEVVTNDVQAEPRFRYIASLPETRSEIVLPLKIEDQVLGVLDIQSDRKGAFHPNDLLVLRALADTISIAINNARMYTALQRRAGQLEMVAEVSDDLTSILQLEQLLPKVTALIQDRLGFPHVHLFTVHPTRRQIIYEAGSGARSQALKDYIINLDADEGLISWVARKGESVLAGDVSREPRFRPSPFPPQNTSSEMTIPLIYDNQVVGILDIQSDRLNAFDADDLFLCEALADSVAVAIHNADLFRTERWRRQVADSLREVAGLVSAEVSLDDVLDRILRELEHNLPCDAAAVWLMEGDELYPAHAHGVEIMDLQAATRRWSESAEYLTTALAADEPVIRKPGDTIGPTGMALGFSADYSSIASALRAGGRPLGVLTLAHHTPGRYGHEAQAITATFANYAAVAIENARLFDAAQEQAYASAALLQVAQAVANSNSLEEIIGSVVRITPILVGVKACGIYLWQQARFQPTQSYGFSDEAEKALWGDGFLPGQFPLLQAVQENCQMKVGLLTPGLPEDWLDPALAQTEAESLYALQTGEHLLIGFPLMIKNDLYGVMLIEEASDLRRFRQKRIEIVTSIAQQVALSIQNEHLQLEMVARERLEHEVLVARQIQKTFLPDHLPEPPGWDLAATWITARQVGGDFYDVFELPGRKLGLLIADVSDKGIPAALFMALTRTLVRAVVFDTPSPAEVMRRVNSLILPNNQQEMFVTAVYGVLSLASGEFTFANAGHNPPVWIRRAAGGLETLSRTGAAMGILEDYDMSDRTIQLGAGDVLLLYTDGLTEAFSPQDDTYGEERLLQLMGAVAPSSARSLLDQVEAAVNEFAGPVPAADDMTLLGVIRAAPVSG